MNDPIWNHGRSKLCAVVALIVILWGIVLPQLARTQRVQQRERWLEENGIHPAAMYYTELPVMDDLLHAD